MKEEIYRILTGLGYKKIAADIERENDPVMLGKIREFAVLQAERQNKHYLLKDETNDRQ